MPEKQHTNPHRPKMPTKQRLPQILHIRYPPIQSNHRRQPPKHQHQNRNHNQSPHAQPHLRILELIKRHPRPHKNERRDIEQQINNARKHRFFGLPIEEPVPGECRAAGESGEEVVRAEEGAYADGEHGERDVLGDVGVPIDEVEAFAEFHEVSEGEAEERAHDDSEGDLVYGGMECQFLVISVASGDGMGRRKGTRVRRHLRTCAGRGTTQRTERGIELT